MSSKNYARRRKGDNMFFQAPTFQFVYGQQTTEQERAWLKEEGFVHVTGLRVEFPRDSKRRNYTLGEKLTVEELGHFGNRFGYTVIVTVGGEVWLGYHRQTPERDKLLRHFCPKGGGAFVPLCNGESISNHDLIHRLAYPCGHLTHIPISDKPLSPEEVRRRYRKMEQNNRAMEEWEASEGFEESLKETEKELREMGWLD